MFAILLPDYDGTTGYSANGLRYVSTYTRDGYTVRNFGTLAAAHRHIDLLPAAWSPTVVPFPYELAATDKERTSETGQDTVS